MNGWVLGALDIGPLGVVLIALAALAGALAIHAMSRRRRTAPTAPPPPVDAALKQHLHEIARRMDLAPGSLPAAHPPHGDGAFVWRQGDVLHYAAHERGAPFFEVSGPPDDVPLYACLRDCSWNQAYIATIGMDEPARSEAIASRQLAALAAADPAWGARFADEIAGTDRSSAA